MKPLRSILAERPLAQHCPELLGSTHSRRDRKQAIAEWLEEACGRLAEELRPLLIGGRLRAGASDVSAQTAGSLEMGAGRSEVHFLATPSGTAAGPAPRLLVSLDNQTALVLTDRLFGGPGQILAEAPTALPDSANLALERIVQALARALAPMAEAEPPPHVAWHHNLARLEAFPRGDYCLNWTVTVAQDGHPDWDFALVVLEADVHALVDGGQLGAAPVGMVAAEAAALREPFAGIPLELKAVLAELRLPVSQLATLSPGQVIPLAPRREVPLQLGSQVIGVGAVGTFDECVALRLTRLNAS